MGCRAEEEPSGDAQELPKTIKARLSGVDREEDDDSGSDEEADATNMVEDDDADAADDAPQANLFSKNKFFLSREVPTEVLLFVIRSCG